jgi:hypothetical protein
MKKMPTTRLEKDELISEVSMLLEQDKNISPALKVKWFRLSRQKK